MPESHDPEYGGPLWVPAEAPDENGVTTEAAARALADGKRLALGTAREVQTDPAVIEAYIGTGHKDGAG